MPNNNNAPEFIGREALTHVAEQVGKQIVMGPAYEDPELLDRLGIQVISGVQYKKTDHLLVRKGGTTRRKKVQDWFLEGAHPGRKADLEPLP